MKRSVPGFALFFLGVVVMMAGAMTWLAVLDYDQHYYYETTYDEFPRHEGELGYYEQLSPEQRRIVDGALDGERYTLSGDVDMPPPVIRRGDVYHKFVSFRSFDWTDPWMFTTALVVVVGFVIVLEGIRRDQFPHTTWADVKYHLPILGGK